MNKTTRPPTRGHMITRIYEWLPVEIDEEELYRVLCLNLPVTFRWVTMKDNVFTGYKSFKTVKSIVDLRSTHKLFLMVPLFDPSFVPMRFVKEHLSYGNELEVLFENEKGILRYNKEKDIWSLSVGDIVHVLHWKI